MSEHTNENLIKECKRIEEDSLYTAEAHHIIAANKHCIGFWLKLIPAVTAAISGVIIVSDIPECVSWLKEWPGLLAIASGLAFGIQSIINPDQVMYEHTRAAKEYTALKHEARALYAAFADEMSHDELILAVRITCEKYNLLVRNTPATTDNAFEKARKRIKAGIHKSDSV